MKLIFYSSLKRINQKWFPFLFILFFCLFIRFLYHEYNQNYFLFSDSLQYIERAQDISQGEPVVNPFRFPLYPILLQFILPLKDMPDISWKNYQLIDFLPVVTLQQYLGVVSAIGIIFIAYKYLYSRLAFIIFGFLFSLFINVFGFEKNILTENVALFFITWLILLIILYIRSQRLVYIFGIVIVICLLFLLHPIYSYLPFFIYLAVGFYLLRLKKYKQMMLFFASLFFFIFLTLYYQSINREIYNYDGLNTISQHNLLAKTFQYKLDAYGVENSSPYDMTMKQCILLHNPNSRINIMDCMGSLYFYDDKHATSSAPIVGDFASRVIMNQFGDYVVKSLMLLPNIIQGTEHDFNWISTHSDIPILSYFWSVARVISDVTQFFMLSFLIFFPLHLVKFLKNPNAENTLFMVIGIIILYTLMLTAFFSFDNYFRKIVPVFPLLLLFCCYNFNLYIDKIRLRKYKYLT